MLRPRSFSQGSPHPAPPSGASSGSPVPGTHQPHEQEGAGDGEQRRFTAYSKGKPLSSPPEAVTSRGNPSPSKPERCDTLRHPPPQLPGHEVTFRTSRLAPSCPPRGRAGWRDIVTHRNLLPGIHRRFLETDRGCGEQKIATPTSPSPLLLPVSAASGPPAARPAPITLCGAGGFRGPWGVSRELPPLYG